MTTEKPENIELFIKRDEFSDVQIFLGDPNADIATPILGEFLNYRYGVDQKSSDSLWKFIEDNYILDPDEDGDIEELKKQKVDPRKFLEPLDEEISTDSRFYEDWLDYDYDHWEGPHAQAFHFLGSLDIDLDGLKFVEGDRPGSNYTYCYVDDRSVLEDLIKELEKKGYSVELKEVD